MKLWVILSNGRSLRKKGAMEQLSRDPNSNPSSSIYWPGGDLSDPVSSFGWFSTVERPTEKPGLTVTGGRDDPGEARPAPALTLSSWATWAFCRYTENRKAVTTELVPRRMNWPRDGLPPLSMAGPSPVCKRGHRGQALRPPPRTSLPSGTAPPDNPYRKPVARRWRWRTGSGGGGKADRKAVLPGWSSRFCGAAGGSTCPAGRRECFAEAELSRGSSLRDPFAFHARRTGCNWLARVSLF